MTLARSVTLRIHAVRRPLRRTATGVLVVAALALTACSPDDGPSTGRTQEPTQEATAVADPEVVLQDQAKQLRAIINDTVAQHPATETPVIGDDDTACELPAEGRWPRQWSYGRRLFITAADSRQQTRQAVERFQNEGWSVRQMPTSQDELRFTVQKDGFVISVAGGADGGTWQLLGSSPCVNEDGTVERRPVG